ncbi:hypothetical protein TOPH_03725 [Tolypocladium ophioglossoides CBS 100239]|uniref:Serine-rich protein n=1 Tax=Tolypocladium ophioglossoides (strain CBS 100239) TaxID=1163406 RepID=A0A0L0NCA7_TOLOC|nr:hypothetical protein TOPH_03725 [Tolypocladium ophioglossoides CBS 100239]
MSASPPPSPERRVLHERSPSERNKLQIRLVPYSPPRLSSDGGSVSAPSRPVSYAGCSPGSPPSWPARATGRDGAGHDQENDRENDQEHDQEQHDQDHGPRGQPCSSPLVSCVVPPPSRLWHVANATFHATSNSSLNANKAGKQPSATSLSLSPSPSPSPLQQSPSPSWRRPKKVISINSDKTFSLLPQAGSATDSLRSPRLSSTVPSSSYDLSASSFLGDERPSSPLTPLVEQSPLASPRPDDPGTASSSPWNYRFVGGLRKVHRSASVHSQALPVEASSSREPNQTPAPLPEPLPTYPLGVARLHAKQSSHSSQSGSTSSERSNYKTFAYSSPAVAAAGAIDRSAGVDFESLPSTSSHSNINILGESSSDQSVDDQQRPRTGESEANYLVHGDLSPSSSILAGPKSRLRSEFSRESLLVPPLRPAKRNVLEQPQQPGLSTSRSRDSIRTGSLSSISSIIIEEATRSLFAAATTIHMPSGVLRQNSSRRLFNAGPAPQQHQWSSALSTVISESEGGSQGPSRSLSLTGHGHRNSQADGVSSLLHGFDEGQTRSGLTMGGSPECPPAAYCRIPNREQNYSTVRLIRDHDEHGDGLADLEELHHRPSRTRLYSFLSNYSSDRNLRSSGSSRSNSLNRSAIPTWARLYYGSGERRFLAAQASSDSLFSEFNDGSQAGSFLSRSPSAERATAAIYSPRRRPREAAPRRGRREVDSGADGIAPYPAMPVARGVKKQTSSIWSPHLRRDRRASRYSIWEPPSAVWSTDGSFRQRQNLQPILFVLGFIFPFGILAAWMVASFLPLPPRPQFEMVEGHHSTNHLDLRLEANQMMGIVDARRHSRAQWWRNLNRAMAIVGIFVVGAVIALIITGVKQQWGS